MHLNYMKGCGNKWHTELAILDVILKMLNVFCTSNFNQIIVCFISKAEISTIPGDWGCPWWENVLQGEKQRDDKCSVQINNLFMLDTIMVLWSTASSAHALHVASSDRLPQLTYARTRVHNQLCAQFLTHSHCDRSDRCNELWFQ